MAGAWHEHGRSTPGPWQAHSKRMAGAGQAHQSCFELSHKTSRTPRRVNHGTTRSHRHTCLCDDPHISCNKHQFSCPSHRARHKTALFCVWEYDTPFFGDEKACLKFDTKIFFTSTPFVHLALACSTEWCIDLSLCNIRRALRTRARAFLG